MKIISLNCRGLGSPPAVQALLRLRHIKNPDAIFLMEMRLKSDKVQSIKFKSGFNCCMIVNCKGNDIERVECLILFWKEML